MGAGRTLILILLVLLILPTGSGLLVPFATAQTPISKRDVGALLESIEHPNPFVRIEAIDELGRRRDLRSLLPLLERLRDEVASVRAHAAEALRVLGDERAAPFLARALEDDDPTVRCRALLSLGELAGRYVGSTVRHHLTDPSPVVRAAAVRALGEIGDPLSLDSVLEAQKGEPRGGDQPITACALVAAAKLGGVEGLRRSLALAKPLLPDSWFLRATAAHAVGLARDKGRADWLEELLRRDEDSRVCQAAAAALVMLGEERRLLPVLELSTGYRRKAAVAALAKVEGLVAREALIGATRDPDPLIRLEAASVLAGRGEVEVLSILIDLLGEDPPIWMGALDVLELRTGRPFGRNPPRWAEWCLHARERLVFDPKTGRFEEAH